MSFLDFNLKTVLLILRICLVIRWIAFIGMFHRIHEERIDSQRKVTTLLSKVFVPIVQEREAAQNLPQGGNYNGPPGLLSAELKIAINW